MAVESTTSSSPAWSELLPELLGRIAASCPRPADRAGFRAVCRSWHAAARPHCSRTPLLPWAVLPDGSFLTLSDGGRDLKPAILPYDEFVQPARGPRSLALPENTTCVGSTGGWLALRHSHRDASSLGGKSFLLHNPFSGTTVPLPEVDAVAARAAPPGVFELLKVLMRSTAEDDVMTFLSYSRSYPLVLSVPGKGAWVPEPLAPPFMHIVDVAFLGDKLYGITKAEDLFSFGIALHDGQIPEVTGCERVIRHPLEDQGYDYVQWSDVDDEGDQDYDEDGGGEEDGSSENENGDEELEESPESDYSPNSENAELIGNQVPSSVDRWFDEDENPPREIIVIRYLVDANGKLIMVRRHLAFPDCLPRSTRKVEVFEADTDACAWVPVDRLGDGGQAIFISTRFSKCVSVCAYEQGRLDEDAIYFVDTGEAFDMRSGAISPALWCLCFFRPTWVFPPDL
ncbi:unnamed protein product [Urochloa humidicola]